MKAPFPNTASKLSPRANLARLLERGDMDLLGIDRTSRLGRRYNARHHGAALRWRRGSVDAHLRMLAGPARPERGWCPRTAG